MIMYQKGWKMDMELEMVTGVDGKHRKFFYLEV
jgi:hypothetical protein